MIPVQDFKQEVWRWAEEIGVQPREIHIRTMRRKWASCSSRGRVTFAYALLNQSYETRVKAIVHELLHLRYPNHGKMFTSLLAAYLSKEGIDAKSVVLE